MTRSLPIMVALLLLMPTISTMNYQVIPAASATTLETNFFIVCTSTGELCDPPFSVNVDTDTILRIQYLVPEAHCASGRLHISVDGTPTLTTAFLGWHGAPPPFNSLPLSTGILDLGPVTPGTHTVSLQVEGQISGCDTEGQVSSWGGKLFVYTDPFMLRLFENGNPSDLVVGLNQPITAVAIADDLNGADQSVDSVTFKWIDGTGFVVSETTKPLSSQAEDTFSPNELGEWSVEADFNNGTVLRHTLEVPFFVLPESSIGGLAIVGSSLAALGAFVSIKHRRTHVE